MAIEIVDLPKKNGGYQRVFQSLQSIGDCQVATTQHHRQSDGRIEVAT